LEHSRSTSVGRYYDPATGQFLTVDPLVDETGEPYAYTGGDPVNATDPSGNMVVGSGASFGETPLTVEAILSDPAILNGLTPNEVQAAIGDTPGWVQTRLFDTGSPAEDGWALRQVTPVCSADGETLYTGRTIFWNLESTSHPEFPDRYWKVSSGEGGTARYAAAKPTGPVELPGETSDVATGVTPAPNDEWDEFWDDFWQGMDDGAAADGG